MTDAIVNWSLEKMAQALDLPAATVERWIRQGRIPIRIKGADCVFSRSALEKWAGTHGLTFTLPQKSAEPITAVIPETLLVAMNRGGVHYSVGGDAVASVLKSAVERMDFLDPATKSALHERLLERESLASTGIGRGIAVPHPRAPIPGVIESPAIVTCFLKTPVNFGAVDDQPVFALFVLISTTIQEHLRLLSRLSYCLRNDEFIRFLRTAPSDASLLDRIGIFEDQLDLADGCENKK